MTAKGGSVEFSCTLADIYLLDHVSVVFPSLVFIGKSGLFIPLMDDKL